MTTAPTHAAPVQCTIGLIKPDAYGNDLHPDIIEAIQHSGLTVRLVIRRTFSPFEAEAFYAEHRGKSFFRGLITFMCSGPLLILILEGPNAIARFRALIGPSDPAHAGPDTLRARFGTGGPANAVHGSDSPEAARREYELLFPEPEMFITQLAS